jgi:hypothetical protein
VTERPYASSECPYCRAKLDPPPLAKKRCPTCRQPIFVRSGPDGLRYLLQEGDLPVLEQAWVEHYEAQEKARSEEGESQAAQTLVETLVEYQQLGVRVEIMTDEHSCAECRKFRGHVFDPRAAPVLPYARCRNDACRCDYLPVS